MKLEDKHKFDIGAKFLDYMNSPDDRQQLLDWMFETIESLEIKLPNNEEMTFGVGSITFMNLKDAELFERGADWMRNYIKEMNQ